MNSLLLLILLVAAPPFDHAPFTAVLKKHVKHGRVDYDAIGADDTFKTYLKSLQDANPNALQTRAEKLAFWINAYNAITIFFINQHSNIKSIKDIKPNVWKEQQFSIGGKPYTLDHIEHNIILGELGEVRAHFGLVCAAKSCPILRSDAYVASRLSQQLDEQVALFLNNPQRNRFDAEKKTVFLSKIFDWYKSDFIRVAGSVQTFIEPYLANAADKTLLMQPDVTIEYLDYDWRLNN
ncbi:MAG: hypothetical protein HY22_10120 [[Candidatus Thermochlorobacteriaceae] bacterium GBChlB]|nr:MAG: hypothetical protein HY22_10120 [[Candidatus Thermochlorobacteriaceae] bacterium GBChlB]